MIGNAQGEFFFFFFFLKKKGHPDEVNNFRPISMISVVAKVFERIVYG